MRTAPQAGIYRHYKGPLYQFLALAHDANHDDRAVAVYMPLQLDAAHLGPRMAVRTVADFLASVHVSEAGDNWPTCPGADRCPLIEREPGTDRVSLARYHQTHRPRFEYLGPELTAEMLPGARVEW